MRTRTTVPTVALLLVTALVGACGGGDDGGGVASLSGAGSDGAGSATSTTLSEEEAEQALLDWAECMREQGVDVPDPQISEDGGVSIQVGSGPGGDDEGESDGDTPPTPMDREAVQQAEDACGQPPMVGSFTEEDREQMEQDALEFSECMRDEGLEDFPDPDFSSFGPGVRHEETAEAEDGEDGDGGEAPTARVFGPWGEIDLDDPEVAAAFEACSDLMGGGPGERRAVTGSGAGAEDS
jgi:hypothetical protein